MRQIFLDTETTGLYPAQGHRIIEVAGVEVINRRITNNHFHMYLNPDREIDPAAQEVHGITLEFLQDKPHFEDIVNEFLDFVQDSELVIHNAPFDIGFLNAELGKIGRPDIQGSIASVVDTLKMAKELRPGQRNNLDALCRHYGINNSQRTLHGALLDAELLADVYLAMTRGQESLMIDMMDSSSTNADFAVTRHEGSLKVVLAQENELTEHRAYLDALSKSEPCLWDKLQKLD